MLLVTLFALVGTAAAMEPFVCDGSALWVGIDNPTRFHLVNSNGGLTEQFNVQQKLNGYGYNRLDNFMYGIAHDQAPGDIVRIGSDGMVEVIGNVPELTNGYTGDVDENGVLWAHQNHHIGNPLNGSPNDQPFYKVDLDALENGSPAVTPQFVECEHLSDIAFGPDGLVYGFNSVAKKLCVFDPANGNIVAEGEVENQIGRIGAIFFDGAGKIWAYDNDGTLYNLDHTTGLVVESFGYQPVDSSDGASCFHVDENMDNRCTGFTGGLNAGNASPTPTP